MQSASFAIVPAILALVFFGLITVTGTVGLILFFAGRSGSGVRRVGGSMALVCGLLGLGLVMVGMTVISVPRSVNFQSAIVKSPVPVSMPAPYHAREEVEGSGDSDSRRVPDASAAENTPVAPLPEVNLTPNNDRTVSTDSAAARPDWTNQTRVTVDDVTYAVLTSQQFATVEEARKQIAAEARQMLAQDFEQAYRVSAGRLTALPQEAVRNMAVRDEYVETLNRDFGNFFAPMHRVWWKVELSPAVRDSLFQVWKAESQERRVMLVGGGLLGAIIVLAAISLASRRKPAPPKPTAAEKASAVVLGVGAASLLAKRARRWWNS